MLDKNTAEKLWKDVFGNVEWATDCFGTTMHRDAWSNEPVMLLKPGNNRKYDYSWNIDHIRPKSDFPKESDADFFNNFEPMHRLNNGAKSDNYPHFEIDGKKYKVFKQEQYYGYGIISVAENKKVDWKSVQNRHYK